MICELTVPVLTAKNVVPARIVYVTDGFAPYVLGGMQAVARRHIDALVSSGFEVISVSSRETRELTNLSWRNISMPWPKRDTLQALSPWRYANELKRFSVDVARIIDDVRPHLVYSEGPLIDAYLRRPPDQRVPTIFHPHGLEMFQNKGSFLENAKSWPLRGIVKFHARSADVVISQSKRGTLPRILTEQCGAPPEVIYTLPNSVSSDVACEHLPRQFPIGGRFLFIGRDEPRKGLPTLLKAIEDIDGATLDVVGHSNVPHFASGRVRAHGQIRDRVQLRKFLAAADFLVVPSYAEGMPTVILEAFSQAVPVIATDVGANADVVRAGETGFLIPPRDVDALQRALVMAMELANFEYGRLSSNCLRDALTTYSPTTINGMLVHLVRRLLIDPLN